MHSIAQRYCNLMTILDIKNFTYLNTSLWKMLFNHLTKSMEAYCYKRVYHLKLSRIISEIYLLQATMLQMIRCFLQIRFEIFNCQTRDQVFISCLTEVQRSTSVAVSVCVFKLVASEKNQRSRNLSCPSRNAGHAPTTPS